MRRRVVLPGLTLLLLALQLPAQKRASQPKPPDLELLEPAARREGGNVLVDCRVVNISPKPVRKLNLIFHFQDSDHRVITSKRGQLELEILEPGQEEEFHSQLGDHARAVEFRIEFEDAQGHDLRAENTGPFPIE